MPIDDTLRSPRPRRNAFTLIETVAVLVISGILLSIAVPRLASLRDASAVRAAMTDLGTTFDAARQTAVTRRMMVSIVLDTADGEVFLRSGGKVLGRHG